MKIYSCYDSGTCRNEDSMEELLKALAIATRALRQYRDGKTWQHIAVDALSEIEELVGEVEEEPAGRIRLPR